MSTQAIAIFRLNALLTAPIFALLLIGTGCPKTVEEASPSVLEVVEEGRRGEAELQPQESAVPFGLFVSSWPEHEACVEAIKAVLTTPGERPDDFLIGTSVGGADGRRVFALWHRTAFLPENANLLGNPGGKSRNALCDAETDSFEGFQYWQ